jgi:hypothetical protein
VLTVCGAQIAHCGRTLWIDGACISEGGSAVLVESESTCRSGGDRYAGMPLPLFLLARPDRLPVVYSVRDKDIPIVHRVVRSFTEEDPKRKVKKTG